MFEVTFGPMLDAFKAQLDVRPGLIGVNVVTGWVGEDGGLESIQFQDINTTEEWSLIGNRRLEERYEVEGFIWVAKPGKGEAVIKAVRDRASSILNEVIDQIQTDPAINNTVRVARISRWDAEQALDKDGRRVCKIDFTLYVEAYLTA